MTKKVKKCLKIGLFAFIISIALCISIGATSMSNYDNRNYITYYEQNGYVSIYNNELLIIPRDFSDDTYYFNFIEYYLFDEMPNSNILTVDNVESFIIDFNLYSNQNTYTTFIEWLSNEYNLYYSGVFSYPVVETLLRGIYNQYNNLYTLAYNNGYDIGYNLGYDFALDDYEEIIESYYQEGYSEGHQEGYSEGQEIGYSQGLTDANALENGLLTIFSAPIYILNGVLDFEVLGVNLFSLISGLITILLFAFIIRKFVI